ncbi:MAG: bifunctional oligoribonuclease/PAP phosphatase NrnA [Pseudomonadota bacterium]
MSYEQAQQLLKNAQKILIGSHINPDGDAIGSMLALGEALEKVGKQVVMFSRDPVPENLKFLSGSEKITSEISAQFFDVAVLVDVASPERVGEVFAKAAASCKSLLLDHHQIEAPADSICCLDVTAASAGEVVYRLLKFMKLPISKSIAEAIYCTIVVDTGYFRYSSTNEAVFKLAAELAKFGVDPWYVAKNLEESYSVMRFKLLGLALNSIELFFEGKFATMEVTQAMIASSGAKIEDSEEFANIPRSIASVTVSALFREMPEQKIRVSLRAKDNIDVAKIAGYFDGGGHQVAAGCTIKGTLAEAKEKIKEQVLKSLEVRI